MTEYWRLIVDPARDGAANMAIDEAILMAVGRGDVPPTLRLYRWEPACLSLGYSQHANDVDMERIAARGWHVVRRQTGGRAILHTDELTYSVTLPIVHPLVTGTIVDSYRRLSGALMAAVQQIGLDTRADKRTEGAKAAGPVCFEVPSDYEITAGGKKLVGSAQVRKQDAALQHGTLPLYGNVTRICDALVFPDETARDTAKDRVVRRATTLSAALDRDVTWDQAAQAVRDAFAERFSLALEETRLTLDEARCAEELRLARYTADEWNRRM